MEISKSALLLANEHQSDQKKMLKMIFVLISPCIRSHKERLCQWNARKGSIKEDFKQNGSLSIS